MTARPVFGYKLNRDLTINGKAFLGRGVVLQSADGSETHYNGFTDEERGSALAAAIAASSAGDQIAIGPGTFTLPSAISVTHQLGIRGCGARTVLDDLALTFSSVDKCSVTDLAIKGRINLTTALNTLLSGLFCDADGADYCVYSTVSSYYLQVLHCVMRNAVLDNCYVTDMLSGRMKFIGNAFQAAGRDGCSLNYGSGAGYLEPNSATILSGNTFSDNTRHGLHHDSLHDTLITGNNCERNGTAGIYVRNPCSITLAGNGVEYNTQAGSGTRAGIAIDLDDGTANGFTVGSLSFSGNIGAERVGIYLAGLADFPYIISINDSEIAIPTISGKGIEFVDYHSSYRFTIRGVSLRAIASPLDCKAIRLTAASGETDGSAISVSGRTRINDWTNGLTLYGLRGVRLDDTEIVGCDNGIWALNGANVVLGESVRLLSNDVDFVTSGLATITYLRIDATTTVDCALGKHQAVQLANEENTLVLDNAASGTKLLLELRQPVTGAAGTLVWPADVRWAGAVEPTWTTTNSRSDVVSLVYADRYWIGSVVGLDLALYTVPLAHYPMDDNAANTTVADISGNARHGTAARNTSLLTTTGKLDSALNSNGTTDAIDLGADFIGTDDCSVAFWFRLSGWGGANKGYFCDNGKFRIYIESTTLRIVSNGSAGALFAVPLVLSLSTTYHVVVVRAASGATTAYINGAAYSGNSDVPAAATENLRLQNRAAGDRCLAGWMDDVRVYDSALTAAEVGAIYNLGSGTVNEI
jgi:hypothetical protein